MGSQTTENLNDSKAGKGEEPKRGFCSMCLYKKCLVEYEMEDGVVTKVEGTSGGIYNQGTLCARGLAALYHTYNPFRVKTPLKRTNPKKGLDVDPGWVEISWEEALDTVGKKLKAMREDDPRKLIVLSGFGASDARFGIYSFGKAFGTPNDYMTSGSMCSVHLMAEITHGAFLENVDEEYCDYVIGIGGHLGPNQGHADGGTLAVVDAAMRGMHVVKVDPRNSAESRFGEWVPIKPGTDLPFLLAMGYVILHELNTIDVWFVKNRTNGPYLIGQDGYYLRDPENGKPLIWDPEDDTAKTFDDESSKDLALEGEFNVHGVNTQPSFSLLKEHLRKYTPEWAEEICSVPANDIRRIAKEFVDAAHIGETIELDDFTFPFRPACVTIGRGLTSHRDGHLAYFMAMVINMLVGAFDVPGGNCGAPNPNALKPDDDGVVTAPPRARGEPFKFPPNRLDLGEFVPLFHDVPYRIVDAILEPEKYHFNYSPEMMLSYGSNLFTKGGDPERISEAFRRIPFFVTISYHLDEHAHFADIVLPIAAKLERDESYARSFDRPGHSRYQAHSSVTRALLEPQHKERYPDNILMDLAERGGFLYGKNGLYDEINKGSGPRPGLKSEFQLDINQKYDIIEIHDRILRSTYGAEDGFEEHACIGEVAMPPLSEKKRYNYFYFPDNQTRHPIYNVLLKRVGEDLLANCKKAGIKHPGFSEEDIRFYYEALPAWKPNPTYSFDPDFDLQVIMWRTPILLHDINNTNSNPLLQEISSTDPYFGKLLMNSATAARKGFKDGDRVFVEAQFGGKIGPVPIKLTDLIHHETVGIASGLSRKAMGMNPITSSGISWNRLIPSSWDTIDILTGGIGSAPRIKIYRAEEG